MTRAIPSEWEAERGHVEDPEVSLGYRLLAAHVVRQAINDLTFGIADKVLSVRERPRMIRRSARFFLRTRFWEPDNLWGQLLKGCIEREEIARVVDKAPIADRTPVPTASRIVREKQYRTQDNKWGLQPEVGYIRALKRASDCTSYLAALSRRTVGLHPDRVPMTEKERAVLQRVAEARYRELTTQE